MFALGHPEKITDFAYRAMHETVLKAKLITVAFYGKGPKYSYYNGCSTGGRQGLIEITKFPEDFDAATVGACASSLTRRIAIVTYVIERQTWSYRTVNHLVKPSVRLIVARPD